MPSSDHADNEHDILIRVVAAVYHEDARGTGHQVEVTWQETAKHDEGVVSCHLFYGVEEDGEAG